MKKILLLMIIFMALVACSDDSIKDPPEITIRFGETNITYLIGLSSWDGEDYDREDTFHTIVKNDFDSLPYIQLDSEITFNINEKDIPEKMVLYEYVLDENGNNDYAFKEVPFKWENGEGSFVIDTQVAALLSSNSVDNAPDATIRGVRLICTWGKNECEYAFIIRTDAP